MARVDRDLITVITTAIGTLTYGTNIFDSPLREVEDPHIPAKAVFVFQPTGGPTPTVYADGGAGNNLNEHVVQILIRGDADDLSDARDLADSVYSAVRKCTPANTQGCQVIESGPNYLNTDEDKHHMFSMNCTIFKNE